MIALSQRMLYIYQYIFFCDKIRMGTWESAPVLAAWVVLLNIAVKRCTSSDVESKSLFKAGVNRGAKILSRRGSQ